MMFQRRLLLIACIASSVAPFASSCTMPPQQPIKEQQTSATRQPLLPSRVTQLNFGREASFALCAEFTCPTITRKTLALSQPVAVTPTIPPPPDADTSPVTRNSVPHNERQVDARVARPTEPDPPPVTVHFAFGDASLSASGKAALDHSIPIAKEANRIVIAGRTDNIGSPAVNQALATARARAVRDYLLEISPSHDSVLLIDARGLCCFIASNDTAEGRRQNRRVEITFQ